MVEIEPGIQVVSDYDYPVFYSDNMYWRYDGGVWYSSQWHDRGWATSYSVPERVRRVDRPTQYVHYRSNARTEYQPGSPAVRDHRNEGYREAPRNEPVVRDHRDEGYREAPRNEPVVRDHRDNQPVHNEPVRSEPPRNEPVVRDHRDATPPPAQQAHPAQAPVVRDHRDAPAPPPKKRDHR